MFTHFCVSGGPIFHLVAAFLLLSILLAFDCYLPIFQLSLAPYFVFLSPFSLYRCYIVLLILMSSMIFPTPFSTHALTPFTFPFVSCVEYVQSMFSSSLSMYGQSMFL